VSGLAATQGWLVFEPNHRGSVGYGDAFGLGIIAHIVSRPGRDISEGVVHALVKDSLADPHRLNPRRLQLRRLHDQLAPHPDHAR
jgi:dipeptidyl aminopeptidase/acylaminoacyl peptidase